MGDVFPKNRQQSQQPAESAIIFQPNVPHKSTSSHQLLQDKTGSSFSRISSLWKDILSKKRISTQTT